MLDHLPLGDLGDLVELLVVLVVDHGHLQVHLQAHLREPQRAEGRGREGSHGKAEALRLGQSPIPFSDKNSFRCWLEV